MATLCSSIPSLHSDIRAEAVDVKRDRDAAAKWYPAMEERERQALIQANPILDPSPPAGRPRYAPGPHMRSRTNAHSARACRLQEAQSSARADVALSRSLLELVAPTAARAAPPDNDAYLYSYDASTSPHETTALGGLVDRAVVRFNNRKTEEQVRREWELIDANDADMDVSRHPAGTKRGRARNKSPRAGAGETQVHGFGADDEDWEKL